MIQYDNLSDFKNHMWILEVILFAHCECCHSGQPRQRDNNGVAELNVGITIWWDWELEIMFIHEVSLAVLVYFLGWWKVQHRVLLPGITELRCSLQLPRTPLAAALVSSSTATAEISRAEVSVARNIGLWPPTALQSATNAFHREKRRLRGSASNKRVCGKSIFCWWWYKPRDHFGMIGDMRQHEIMGMSFSAMPPPFLSIHKTSKLLAWWLWSSSHLKMSVREKASPTKDRWYSISSKKGSNLGEACKHDQCPSSDGKL